MLDRGLDPGIRDEYGRSLLFWTCASDFRPKSGRPEDGPVALASKLFARGARGDEMLRPMGAVRAATYYHYRVPELYRGTESDVHVSALSLFPCPPPGTPLSAALLNGGIRTHAPHLLALLRYWTRESE